MKAEPCGCRPIRTDRGEYLPLDRQCPQCRAFSIECHAKATISGSEVYRLQQERNAKSWDTP